MQTPCRLPSLLSGVAIGVGSSVPGPGSGYRRAPKPVHCQAPTTRRPAIGQTATNNYRYYVVQLTFYALSNGRRQTYLQPHIYWRPESRAYEVAFCSIVIIQNPLLSEKAYAILFQAPDKSSRHLTHVCSLTASL